MNAGPTMERVYLDLKVNLLAGRYPPGSRLDPIHLGKTLRASPTPVREALHRLAGERIIDSWHQEGFRTPILAESDMHDLYGWAGALLAMALKDKKPLPDQPGGLVSLSVHDDYTEAIDSLFWAIAQLADNRELRFAIMSLSERSHVFRAAEARVDGEARPMLAAMEEDFRFGRWSALRAKITRFHRRRLAFAGRVGAALRPREEPLR